MSYRIDYRPSQKKSRMGFLRLPVLTVLCFLLFLFLVNTYWPEGADRIAVWQESVTVMVLDRFGEDLHRGEPLAEAFSAFLGSFQP